MRVGKAWAMFVAVTLGSIGTARAEVAAPPPATPNAPASVAAPAAELPPRPPLPPDPPSPSLPWERHLEVGGDLLFLARPTSAPVHLAAAVG